MQWGIVGAGAHALQRIVPALRAVPGEALRGVVGRTAERGAAFAAAAGGCIAYPTLAAMLDDAAVEAVFISTPNDQHRAQAEQAARAGKHMLVEKPMALTEADCRAMMAAAEAAGVALGIGFQQRHAPVHQALRDLVRQGMFGAVVMVRAEWHTAYPPWTNWRADPQRAGSDVLGAVGVHVFDLLGYLLGSEVADVAAVVDRSAETGLDQSIAAALRYGSGALGTVTLTRRARSAVNSVHVLGTSGAATGVGTLGMTPTGRLELLVDGQAETRMLPVVDLYAAQFAAFARAVARGEPPDAGGPDGLASVALANRLLGLQEAC